MAEPFRCEECNEVATWRGQWSDRHLYVCAEHRDVVRRAHNGDHAYDQDGITWESSAGANDYESAAKLLRNAGSYQHKSPQSVKENET